MKPAHWQVLDAAEIHQIALHAIGKPLGLLDQLTGTRLVERQALLNTHIVTADRWGEMRRWAATLWQQVQRDGVPLLPESTLA